MTALGCPYPFRQALFADYFGGCPVVEIPGRAFPVTAFYLEDAIEHSGYEVGVWRWRLCVRAKNFPVHTVSSCPLACFVSFGTASAALDQTLLLVEVRHVVVGVEVVEVV